MILYLLSTITHLTKNEIRLGRNTYIVIITKHNLKTQSSVSDTVKCAIIPRKL
jgi:hypothetical protein